MRWLLRILFALVLIVILVIGLPWLRLVRDNVTAGKYVAWLEEHHVKVDRKAGVLASDLTSTDYDADIFLLGEVHGVAEVQELDLILLKHLHEKAGVRFYLAELDPAQAAVVNGYLESGDVRNVKQIFDVWRSEFAQWGNNEFLAKLVAIQKWNAGLEASEKITFVGVDRLHDREFAQRMIGKYGDVADAAIEKSIADADAEKSRYTVIVNNIEAFRATANAPAYGLWGIAHVLKAKINGDVKPLAMRLEERGKAGRIVSFEIVYSNAAMMMPSQYLPDPMRGEGDYTDMPFSQDFPNLAYINGIADLKKVSGGDDFSIFRLAGEGSPYATSDRLRVHSGLTTMMEPFKIEKSDSVFAEYVVLVQNAVALTPYELGEE